MNTTQATTNNLKHVISVNNASGNYSIAISLNDECKNGREDFSITATFWEIGKSRTDRNMMFGGCCHEQILKVNPDLDLFVSLHLSDYKGVPMYAVDNGFYHLKNGFSKVSTSEDNFSTKFKKYYRLTDEQFNAIKDSEDKNVYAYHLVKSGAFESWKKQADEAILLLEKMTGLKFESKATKESYKMPSNMDEIEKRISEGYYSTDNIEQRNRENESAKIEKEYKDIDKDLKNKIDKLKFEAKIKKIVLLRCGLAALDNCIFYDHTNELAFNWKGYDNLTQQQIDVFKEKLNGKLPKGVKIR